MGERREILARLAKAYVAVEGGPGTEHEATVAAKQGATVIPVGRSGGVSRELLANHRCPFKELEAHWHTLGDESAAVEGVAIAVRKLVEAAISQGD